MTLLSSNPKTQRSVAFNEVNVQIRFVLYTQVLKLLTPGSSKPQELQVVARLWLHGTASRSTIVKKEIVKESTTSAANAGSLPYNDSTKLRRSKKHECRERR